MCVYICFYDGVFYKECIIIVGCIMNEFKVFEKLIFGMSRRVLEEFVWLEKCLYKVILGDLIRKLNKKYICWWMY